MGFTPYSFADDFDLIEASSLICGISPADGLQHIDTIKPVAKKLALDAIKRVVFYYKKAKYFQEQSERLYNLPEAREKSEYWYKGDHLPTPLFMREIYSEFDYCMEDPCPICFESSVEYPLERRLSIFTKEALPSNEFKTVSKICNAITRDAAHDLTNQDFSLKKWSAWRFAKIDLHQWIFAHRHQSNFDFLSGEFTPSTTKTAALEQTSQAKANPKTENKQSQIIAGLALAQYAYDRNADRQEATQQIIDDLAVVGVSVDAKTIRRYIQDGLKQIPTQKET